MFTGLVQAVGQISSVEKTANGVRISIEASFVSELEMGESVAVNGVCLTVVERINGAFAADVIPETLEHTTLSGLDTGSEVNLERALRVGDRLGGHFVQGHVDGLGTVREIVKDASGWRVRITPPSELKRFIAHKGSITLDGVSLTVSDVNNDGFEVSLVPHTLEETVLADLREGDKVNLEVDLIARYLENLNL